MVRECSFAKWVWRIVRMVWGSDVMLLVVGVSNCFEVGLVSGSGKEAG